MKFSPAKTLAVAALAALPMIASAQLSANVSLTSNYKFRGQDQDARKGTVGPALQGGFDYAHESGFYIGNWNSSINFNASGDAAHLESDFYGGYKFNAGPLALDLGVLRYQYAGASAANTTELYLGAGYGPFSAKYSHTISKDYFNYAGTSAGGPEGKGTGYWSLGFAQEVAPKLTLKASLGYTNFDSNIAAPNYTDYSIGASYDLGNGFSFSGALVGANKKDSFNFKSDGSSVNKNALILTITKAM